MKQKIVIGFLAIMVLFLGIYALAPQFRKDPPEPKYVVVVAKYADVFKYVVVRRHIDDHIIIKVDDKTFGHIHAGDSILHTGN